MIPLATSPVTVFGPVPSRRLGRSLGIGNVPAKTCSYSRVYCQAGPTPATEIEPRKFWPSGAVVEAVSRHVRKLCERGEGIDFLTFVPDGEPTLDADLGEEIGGLRALVHPVREDAALALLASNSGGLCGARSPGGGESAEAGHLPEPRLLCSPAGRDPRTLRQP